MVLEAIEDHLRGFRDGQSGLGGARVARGVYAIEHVMPRKWTAHWPLPQGVRDVDRDRTIHTLGNLTLLTGKLNSKVSNGAWVGAECKRTALQQHDVLMLNRELLRSYGEWTDETIRQRTDELAGAIVQIWRVPDNHRTEFAHERVVRHSKSVGLADLIGAGLLQPGMSLYPKRRKHAGHVATLLADGTIDVNGISYSRPTEAATAIAGKRTGGWWFFVVDPESGRSLRTIRRDYVKAMAVDVDDADADDDDEEDDN
jgi:hypothetical protein